MPKRRNNHLPAWCTPERWELLVQSVAQSVPWLEIHSRMSALDGPEMIGHDSLQRFAFRKGVRRPNVLERETTRTKRDVDQAAIVRRPCLLCRKPFVRTYAGQFHCPPCREWVCDVASSIAA